MITAGLATGGLHHKSEIPDQANEAPRRLIVEWITQL